MNKRYFWENLKKKFHINRAVPIIVMIVVLGLSIGYSAFSSSLNITGIVTNVRIKKDIRVTGVSVVPESVEIVNNGGTAGNNDYNVNSIYSTINLPNENSSITFNVEITNIEAQEMGILEITGLPDNLDYELLNYNLKDKICDDTGKCSLGIKKYIQLQIKYKENGYDSSDTTYDITPTFNFQPIYTITYTDIEFPKQTCNLVNDVSPSGISYGDEYSCDPGDGIYRTFYVLEDGDNTKLVKGDTGTAGPGEVALIMNENIGEPTAWGNAKDLESTIALPYLLSQTIEAGWTLDVSMPTYDQIYAVNNDLDLSNSTWLYGSYWLNEGFYMEAYAVIEDNDNTSILTTNIVTELLGVRPVITLPKPSGNGYPEEIIGGNTLEINFGESAPSNVKVLISGGEITDYTYSNGVLNIPNVSGNVEIVKEEPKVILAQHITNLYTPNSTVANNNITYNIDTINGIIDDGLGGTVSSGGNLRYYGANPANYIDIGDRDSSNNPILWRIIGVFETKYATDELPCNVDIDGDLHYDNCASEKLVKIIRDDSIGDYSWNYTPTGGHHNNWSDSTLKAMLNGAYYNSSTTSYYNNNTTATSVNFKSNGSGLSTSVQSKVENVLWNLGGISAFSSDSNYYLNLYSEGYYKWERGTTVYSGSPTEWVGKIALIYPSDYGYATDFTKCSDTLYYYDSSTDSYACRTNDWLYKLSQLQWTLTPYSSSATHVFTVSSTGKVGNSLYRFIPNVFVVSPTLYLKSDVLLTGGSGIVNDTVNDPYVIGM